MLQNSFTLWLKIAKTAQDNLEATLLQEASKCLVVIAYNLRICTKISTLKLACKEKKVVKRLPNRLASQVAFLGIIRLVLLSLIVRILIGQLGKIQTNKGQDYRRRHHLVVVMMILIGN